MTNTISELEDKYQLKTYARLPFPIAKGDGCHVFDQSGERYLDLYGGHAVVSTGHCHPKVVSAIQEQAGKLLFYSNVANLEIRALAAEELMSNAPKGLTKVFFVNSGSEATDNAIKLARLVTQRKTIVSFEGGFHGRTMGALSATGIEKFKLRHSPLLSNHKFLPFGDVEALTKCLVEESCAGVIVEPIQSMAGCRMASPEFYQVLRKLCTSLGTKLIYDEIQTGIGRTGDFFFAPKFDVVPDIMALGKGIASGVPMGALMVSQDIADALHSGDLGSTFGGGPLAAAAMKATFEVIKEEGLLANVNKLSELLVSELTRLPQVKSISGMGFILGIEVDGEGSYFMKKLLEKKIIVGTSNQPSVLRILPPLTLSYEHVKEFVEVFAGIKAP